jgi:hypothetical protein
MRGKVTSEDLQLLPSLRTDVAVEISVAPKGRGIMFKSDIC